MTFERKVTVQYLAHLLVGDGAVEFGKGRRAVSVAFQQDPDHPVDDLVVCTARTEELEPSWEIALEVRRSPKLVQSDEKAQRLFRKFVRALMDAPKDGIESRWGLVVAGPQPHAEQLAKLADLAAEQMDATDFFNLVRTPGKFDSGVRNRLEHVERLVECALEGLDGAEPDTALVREARGNCSRGLWSACHDSSPPTKRIGRRSRTVSLPWREFMTWLERCNCATARRLVQ